ncbi:MAG: hypothetical protein FJX71_00230 [Alphaproteobacteria bacterium]|nr:hypothetical protein [Alphaproteobacteria bacterium]
MSKKLLLVSVVLVPAIVGGVIWYNQANEFEKSMRGEVARLQESLKIQGVSFTCEDLKISKLFFKAHLVNPVISLNIPFPLAEKDSKNKENSSFTGKVSINGEVSACYSPFMNTVTFEVPGQLHFKTEEPFGFDLALPESNDSKIIIKRREYDLWGKNPFLSLDNIQGITIDSKGITALLNNQKFLEAKDSYSSFSTSYAGKGIDISLVSNVKQMQFFNVAKILEAKGEEYTSINKMLNDEFSMQAALGPQDQKFSVKFHVNDWESYFNDLVSMFKSSRANNEGKDVFENQMEKMFPEGTRFEIEDFTSNNKVYLSSMSGSVERLKNNLPIKITVDYKVTDEWEKYWELYHKKIVNDLSHLNLSEGIMSVIKDEKVFKTIIPQLQTLGQTQFTLAFDIPVPIAKASSGTVTVQFKSAPYDLGVDGKFSQEGGSAKVKARNADELLGDLEGYFTRASAPFAKSYENEIKTFATYLHSVHKVINKVLEPQGAKEQSVDIHMDEKGFKVGKYDILELAALLMGPEASGGQASTPDEKSVNG